MAFDQATRNWLQRFVTEARGVLETEFTRQLQNEFGLDPSSGAITSLEHLRQLTDAQRETARILRDTLAHYCAAEHVKPQAGLERIVREQAFTVLNRLAALRMAEARGLLVESVGNAYQAKGFQLYSRLAGAGLGETGEAYRVYLFSVFDELAQDLPSVFDRHSPQGRLFPREAALLVVLKLINDPEIDPLWAEDETIGWIYQYFNSKEERKKMRDANQAPQNSRELAVRNQFFTPRYVVEFLVDNTLGRLWFNATGGQTSLRERCQYLLVKSDEQSQATQPRDPRTLKLLDPACGSMHFGLYAFDLFLEIYREAWAWEQQQGPGSLDVSTHPRADFKPLTQTYGDEAAFLRDVPRLIIDHNIHGVDIDPRAAQIATLALWLRAQRAWHELLIRAKDRPLIGCGHVIAAIAPPTEREMRQQFAGNLDQRDAELFDKTLQLLKGLPELGVLLQIERELPHLIRQIYGGTGTGLFAAQDEDCWQQAEARLRAALTEFAQASKSNYQSRLFAYDALDGMRLIDLSRENFDVIVMNPPFGDTSLSTEEYLKANYASTKNNLYSVFVQRATELCSSGFIGIISPRTFIVYRDFELFRHKYLLSESCHILCMADLGWDVLDGAQVETAAYILRRDASGRDICKEQIGPFFRLLAEPVETKGVALLGQIGLSVDSKSTYYATKDELCALPGSPLAYWASNSLIKLFSSSPPFDPTFAYCGRGAAAHAFYFRLAWEISDYAGAETRWKRLAHGGEYSPFFRENSLLIDWEDDGRKVKEYILKQYPYLNGNYGWAIQDEDKYGCLGLTSGKRNERFTVQLMPKGQIFTNEGQGYIPNSENDIWFLLGYLNSSLVSYFLSLTSGLQKNWIYIRPIPVIPLSVDSRRLIEVFAKESYLIKRNWALGAEESAFFVAPWLVNDQSSGSIRELTTKLIKRHLRDSEKLNENRFENSRAILDAADLSPSDLDDINADFGRHSSDVAFSPWRGNESKDIAADISLRMISYAIGVAFGRWDVGFVVGALTQAECEDVTAIVPLRQPGRLSNYRADYPIDVPQDGILVEDAVHPLDIELRVRAVMRLIWPTHHEEIEEGLCSVVKEQGLHDWLKKPNGFFADHLKRYSKNRRQAPIYWPLSTASSNYTLWLYYPSLTSQTLYTAINDFVEPKLKQVSEANSQLRNKGGGRSRVEERQLEELQSFELELVELRDTLLKLAPKYKPNQDDGVNITAAPLWPLFRLRPWQKALKDTWTKLEKGEYDWAHLAMNFWPDRVREKCKTDKSLAIAHGLEAHFIEPEAKPKKPRGKRKAGSEE